MLNKSLFRLLFIITSLITVLFLLPSTTNAETSTYRHAGWVATDGSPQYSSITGCQTSNDGLYCSRPNATSFASLYFGSFGTLADFGIPSGSYITKLHIRVKGKNSDTQVVGVTASNNQRPFLNTCQLPTDVWSVFLGSNDSIKEFHTFTSSNGLTDCVTASNIDQQKLTFNLRRSSGTAWNSDIDNFEIAFDYVLPSASWKNTGGLNVPRNGHTATLLGDGKVLVIGGENNSLRVRQAEIFNPVSGIWTFVKEPSESRTAHSAHLVTNNNGESRVLVAGGLDSSTYSNKAELYNPSSNTWDSTPLMNFKRFQHASSMLEDGKVLFTGGLNPAVLNSTEVYDPITNTWSTKSSLNIARRAHIQVTFKDSNGNSKVLVSGGVDSNGNKLKSTEVYDPSSNTWTPGPNLNNTRFDFTALLLQDGRILVVGGEEQSTSTAEIYSPATNNWTIVNTSYPYRHGGNIILLDNNKVLASGGDGISNNAQLFDPSTNTWSAVVSMTSPRNMFTLTKLKDGRVLAASGITVYLNTKTSEIYTPGEVLGDSSTPTPTPTSTPTPTPSVSPTPAPFLDLPWDYKNERNVPGRVLNLLMRQLW